MEKLGGIVISDEEHLEFTRIVLTLYENYRHGGEYANLTDEQIKQRTKEERIEEFMYSIKETIEEGTDKKGLLTKQAKKIIDEKD